MSTHTEDPPTTLQLQKIVVTWSESEIREQNIDRSIALTFGFTLLLQGRGGCWVTGLPRYIEGVLCQHLQEHNHNTVHETPPPVTFELPMETPCVVTPHQSCDGLVEFVILLVHAFPHFRQQARRVWIQEPEEGRKGGRGVEMERRHYKNETRQTSVVNPP